MPLAGAWIADSAGDKGIGPVNPADGVGKAQRARNISGDFADIGVILYDAAGNALLGSKVSAASIPVVVASDQGAIPVTLSAMLALIAGTALIGKVGIDQTTPGTTDRVTVGGTTAISATPTISSSPAYASGESLGGKITLASAVRVSGGSGIIQSLKVSDLGKLNGALHVVFFDSDPSGTTFTDNAALDVADADLPKIIGHVAIAATDYADFADNSVATVKGIGMAFKLASGTSLYACLVSRDTKTYTSTSDLTLTVGLLQD